MSIFDNMFEHCHMDNDVFVQGMFWIFVFIATYLGTLYYKYTESCEAAEEELKKQDEKNAALDAKIRAARAPLIQHLARPIEKKMDVPVVTVKENRAKTVSKESLSKKKPEPVQMMAQTPSFVATESQEAPA